MVTIRFVSLNDAPGIVEIYTPIVRDTLISFEEDPPGVEEMQNRIKKLITTYPWFVAEEDGVILGYAYAGPNHERAAYRWSVNVTVYVRAEARGKGVGTKLYARLFEQLKKQKFFRAYGLITQPNPASVALHESMGFKKVSHLHSVGYKHGQWVDVGWWEFEIQPLEPNPSHPLPVQNI